MTPIGRRDMCLHLGAIATAPLLPLWRTSATQQPPVDPRNVPFRSTVDLVRLSVTARNTSGAIIHDLDSQEFDIYENGVRQELGHFGHHETPISVVLLLDKSGSMSGDKMMHAKDGVINFVNALKTGDEVLVIAFSDSVDALGGFGLDSRTIERAVKRVDAESGTRLYDAVIDAAHEVATSGRRDKRALVILSDGEDTASRARLDDAVEAVRKAEVPVYAIAVEYEDRRPPAWLRFGDPLWRPLRSANDLEPLHRLTDGTGGWTYPIQAAKRCKEVCLRIADELRNQYLLGYYPTNQERDGGWRTIEVRTPRLGVTLTTRTGYYAPASL
jgi:Ca-activated chloride channel family protein